MCSNNHCSDRPDIGWHQELVLFFWPDFRVKGPKASTTGLKRLALFALPPPDSASPRWSESARGRHPGANDIIEQIETAYSQCFTGHKCAMRVRRLEFGQVEEAFIHHRHNRSFLPFSSLTLMDTFCSGLITSGILITGLR